MHWSDSKSHLAFYRRAPSKTSLAMNSEQGKTNIRTVQIPKARNFLGSVQCASKITMGFKQHARQGHRVRISFHCQIPVMIAPKLAQHNLQPKSPRNQHEVSLRDWHPGIPVRPNLPKPLASQQRTLALLGFRCPGGCTSKDLRQV